MEKYRSRGWRRLIDGLALKTGCQAPRFFLPIALAEVKSNRIPRNLDPRHSASVHQK